MRILNRVITYSPAGDGRPEQVTYEADQRHADLLVRAYGLSDTSNAKVVPWDKPAYQNKHPLNGPVLGKDRLKEFRSPCMRCFSCTGSPMHSVCIERGEPSDGQSDRERR